MARGIAYTYADLQWGSRQTIGSKIQLITKHWHLIIDGCEVQILTKLGNYSYTFGDTIRISFIIGTTIVRYSYHNRHQRLILQRGRHIRDLRCISAEPKYLEMLASIFYAIKSLRLLGKGNEDTTSCTIFVGQFLHHKKFKTVRQR